MGEKNANKLIVSIGMKNPDGLIELLKEYVYDYTKPLDLSKLKIMTVPIVGDEIAFPFNPPSSDIGEFKVVKRRIRYWYNKSQTIFLTVEKIK